MTKGLAGPGSKAGVFASGSAGGIRDTDNKIGERTECKRWFVREGVRDFGLVGPGRLGSQYSLSSSKRRKRIKVIRLRVRRKAIPLRLQINNSLPVTLEDATHVASRRERGRELVDAGLDLEGLRGGVGGVEGDGAGRGGEDDGPEEVLALFSRREFSQNAMSFELKRVLTSWKLSGFPTGSGASASEVCGLAHKYTLSVSTAG